MSLPAGTDQTSQEDPALSAAERSSGVASTSQPSAQQPAQQTSSQHPQGAQPGPSQHAHGVPVGKHSHHVRLEGLDPVVTQSGKAPHQGSSEQHSQLRELEELFAVLSSWLHLRESRHGLLLWEV